MKKYILILALLLTVAPQSGKADALTLTPAQQNDVARLKLYLNSLKNIEAHFVQANSNGAIRYGDLAIARPGKMRITYRPPDRDFLVADGRFIHMWDDEIQSQTSLPLSSGPASFLLRDPINFHDDVILTGFNRTKNHVEITLTSRENPDEGTLTLIFEDGPVVLRQWRVLDAQGNITGVQLENIQTDVTFPKNTFVFVSPKRNQPYPGQTRR